MLRSLVVLVLAVITTAAQNPPISPVAPARGSISGVVLDAVTGAPVPQVLVATMGSSRVSATTDTQGRYALKDLAPGQYSVSVFTMTASVRRAVTVGPGQDLSSIDLRLPPGGIITGTVLDQNKEPVPGTWVLLVHRQYLLGELRYTLGGATTSDDNGEYRLTTVVPGRAYLVLAKRRVMKIDPISAAPADPKLRRPAAVPTYYPDSASLGGALPVVLRSGETREGVDIRMARSPSYCIEGVLDAGGDPASFQISEQYPSSGASTLEDGAHAYIVQPNGKAGTDGKIRICDLHPGQYQLIVMQSSSASVARFASVPVTVVDEDVRNLRLVAQPGMPLSGQVVWDGAPPSEPVESQVSITLEPLSRGRMQGESLGARSPLPGTFSFPSLLVDEYLVRVSGFPRNLYVKDITYADKSVLTEPLRLGGVTGSPELRVIVARDAGYVTVKASDKDDKPVPDVNVVFIPAGAASEASLASAMISGQTDQTGRYESRALAPGKYLALATTAPIDTTPENTGKLWRARSRAKEVVVSAGVSAQITLEPKAIE